MKYEEHSQYLATVIPTEFEKQKHPGAEIAFIRRDLRDGQLYTIYACQCYESYSQWNAGRDILADNVPYVEDWRRMIDSLNKATP